MPAPRQSLLLITVVLIVLALVYFLVSVIFALRRSSKGLDATIAAGREIIEKSEPVNAIVGDINTNLDAAVDALEGLLVKKAGMEDAVGLVDGLYPGAAAQGRDFPGAATTTQGAAHRRGLHARHAHARPPRARGADRRRQPGRRPGPAQRARRQPGGARALPGGRGPAARRSSAPTPPSNTRLPMQTPAPFDYERATSLEGAIASLKQHEDSRVVAGGHSLLPMMKLRLAHPSRLIDINDLTELQYIREEGDEIAIGALTRHFELLDSELLALRFPAFRDAEQVIADPVVRNRGTIGGSLCQADAAEDLLRGRRRAEGVTIADRERERGRSRWASSTSARG